MNLKLGLMIKKVKLVHKNILLNQIELELKTEYKLKPYPA